ncbi:MAG: hypothetical protein KF784_02010 [Fimbriimonadaceae bacterium]|nr:hypothetical protein [Fimbriimonadaceae bacterium]
MKLNLIPQTVNEGKKTRAAIVGAVLIAAAGFVIGIGMAAKSSKDLTDAREEALKVVPTAKEALDESLYADKVMSEAKQVILNINLAEAMKKHSAVYPDLYDEVRPYIPGFYRVVSMSAAANGPDSCTVTLVGYLRTQQQYADMMFALRRINNGQVLVTRSGYQYNEMFVPPITDNDQNADPRLRSDAPVPDDPLERMDYFLAKGSASGYEGAGGFGSGVPGVRGAMPNEHQVTVTITIPRNIQTPNPRASLSGVGSAGTGPGGPGGGPGGPNVGGGGPGVPAAEDR